MPTATHTANFIARAGLNQVGAQQVYIRERWNEPWVLAPHLWCNWASYVLAPGQSAAELSWNYGWGKRYNEAAFHQVLPDAGTRRYVRVDFENAFGQPFRWTGMVNALATQAGGEMFRLIGGAPDVVESGRQTIHCVGMQKLLYDTVIRTSAWRSEADGEKYFVDRGLTFNAVKADGTPGGNKSSVKVAGQDLFSGKVLDDDAWWKIRDIIVYLVNQHAPRDKGGIELPVNFDAESLAMLALASKDERPIVETHARSFGELLDELLPPQRFWSWRLHGRVDTNVIELKIISLTGDDLLLPSGATLEANPVRWSIANSLTGGQATHVLSHAEAVDRVRYQGARATSTFTINESADDTVAAGWNATQEARYDSGASGSDEYIAALLAGDKETAKRLNWEARSRDEVRPVYARLIIPTDWDGVAKNGEGGGGFDFCPIVTETARFKFYQRELYLLDTLPLKDGYDYSVVTAGGGTDGAVMEPTKLTTGPYNHVPPLVFLKVPDSSPARYVQGDRAGTGAEGITVPGDPIHTFSVRVSVPRHDRAVVLDVVGAQQWILGGSDFSKPAEEESIDPLWDWRDIVLTVAAEWDAFCEGVWPATKAALPNQDAVREVLLQAGDEFRLDWLVPQTVVGIKRAPGHVGELVRSTLGGWIQDDRKKLIDRARLAFAWYGVERRSITLTTARHVGNDDGLRILDGEFVVDVDGRSVNSVVTERRIDAPPGVDGGDPPPPTLTLVTDYIADLDLHFSPPLAAARAALTPAAALAALPAVRGSDYPTR